MANQKSPKRKFNGMSYREAQCANSKNRIKLHQDDQRYLKDNGYKNVSWDNVIKLYLKIEEFLDKYQFEELSLEELFLEADRIGNKYLTSQEIEEYQQKLSQEVNEIAEEIDRQFPDTEIEIIDFSNTASSRGQKKRPKKSY